jgi:hypothetical protein
VHSFRAGRVKAYLIALFAIGGVAVQSGFTPASYQQPCNAKYESSLGWSQPYGVNCLYATGFELNQATATLRFDNLKTYAVIFWAPNQATIVRLEELLLCGIEATGSCAEHAFGKVHGRDQEGRRWRICQPNAVLC